MNNNQRFENTNQQQLNIDTILTTQPELGPSIPDGGYGWIVFIATLFFHALIPSLIVSFGIFLVFIKLENLIPADYSLYLWDENLLYLSLFFIASWTLFDPLTKTLIQNSMWPRLFGTGGTCLTCAGLLFAWIAMAGSNQIPLFVLAGILTGLGASIQITQCEVLLGQYFRTKLPILRQLTQSVVALGFVFAPIVLGRHIIHCSLLYIILWYQAIILQGLIACIAFKKPNYLKNKQKSYHFITSTNGDDEEDIFSKNSRELQIKRQTSTSTTIETIEINQIISNNKATTSTNPNWVTFNEENEESKQNRDKINRNSKQWETFDDNSTNNQIRNQLERAFSNKSEDYQPIPNSEGDVPKPLFSVDVPVNNNNTYAYDDDSEDEKELGTFPQPQPTVQPAVFLPNSTQKNSNQINIIKNILKEPTFYKTLITVITTKFSIFLYFTLLPSYLYVEIENFNIRLMTTFIGCLSIVSLLFSIVVIWIRVNKHLKAVCLAIWSWIGTAGYFLLSDYTNITSLLAGAFLTILSISALQQIGLPLLLISPKANWNNNNNQEQKLIGLFTSLAFSFFLILNLKYENCFRLMAIFHFITGCLWLANYIYKKLKNIN